jgi:hypothetical protein
MSPPHPVPGARREQAEELGVTGPPPPDREVPQAPAQEIVTPLSTGKSWPVTIRDSSLAR